MALRRNHGVVAHQCHAKDVEYPTGLLHARAHWQDGLAATTAARTMPHDTRSIAQETEPGDALSGQQRWPSLSLAAPSVLQHSKKILCTSETVIGPKVSRKRLFWGVPRAVSTLSRKRVVLRCVPKWSVDLCPRAFRLGAAQGQKSPFEYQQHWESKQVPR